MKVDVWVILHVILKLLILSSDFAFACLLRFHVAEQRLSFTRIHFPWKRSVGVRRECSFHVYEISDVSIVDIGNVVIVCLPVWTDMLNILLNISDKKIFQEHLRGCQKLDRTKKLDRYFHRVNEYGEIINFNMTAR